MTARIRLLRVARQSTSRPSGHQAVLLHDLPQDSTQPEAVDRGMEERSIQVDSVVVATPLFPYLEHVGPAQVADKAPDGTSRQRHVVRDLTDGAVRVDGYVEDDGAMAGNEIEGVNEISPPVSDISSGARPYLMRSLLYQTQHSCARLHYPIYRLLTRWGYCSYHALARGGSSRDRRLAAF